MSRKQVKTVQLQALLKEFEGTQRGHKVLVGKPLNNGAYELRIDDKTVFDGTKREIYTFLKAYIKVYDLNKGFRIGSE